MPNYRPTQMPYPNSRQMPMSPMNKVSWDDMPLGMAYVPWQTWREIYEPEKGFHYGTIFKELNLPFLGKRGVKR